MRLSYNSVPLGSGGFSKVYEGQVTDKTPPQVIALKKSHITNHVKHPLLLHEGCALIMLKGHPSIPKVYGWGRSQYYEYLALELLGEDLSTAFTGLRRSLNMRNFVALICQMIDVVEYLHSRGIVHCDVKPSNFILGPPRNPGRLYLVDFGLCRPYRDLKTEEHLPDRGMPGIKGTRAYASLNVHFQRTPSRRDDMASLAYTIADLLRDRLPWLDEDCSARICQMKQAWSGEALCAGYPSVFGEFVEYTRHMGYADKPNYAYWKRRFREVIPGLPEDPLWEEGDCSEPLVGVTRSSVGSREAEVEVTGHECKPPKTVSVGEVSGSEHGYSPRSTWGFAYTAADEDILGDELSIVRANLEMIDDVPSWPRGRTVRDRCPLEVMHSF